MMKHFNPEVYPALFSLVDIYKEPLKETTKTMKN